MSTTVLQANKLLVASQQFAISEQTSCELQA